MNLNSLLYLSNFFYKKALWSKYDIEKAHELISWLIGRTISLEEIEGWLNQNENILDYYISSFKNYQKYHYEHYIVYNEIKQTDLQHTIISIDKKPSDDILLEINKEAFLKGYKNIPNLYIYIALTSRFKNEPITKEMVPYDFLNEILKPIIGNNVNDREFQNEKLKFIEENKNVIDKVINSFAYIPKKIGKGDDGIAYSIGSNLVLKIFKDQFNFIKSKEAFDRLHKNPEIGKNEAMIYDVGILGNFYGTTIYYLIMEKMEPINQGMKKHLAPIIGAIGTYIKNNKEIFKNLTKELYDPKNHNKIKLYLNSESEKIKDYIYSNYPDEIETIESAEDLNKDWVKNLSEEILFKSITNRGDLHLGNIGLTNYGKFIYFDPAHENWEDDLNIPSRDDIDFLKQDNIEADSFNNLFI